MCRFLKSSSGSWIPAIFYSTFSVNLARPIPFACNLDEMLLCHKSWFHQGSGKHHRDRYFHSNDDRAIRIETVRHVVVCIYQLYSSRNCFWFCRGIPSMSMNIQVRIKKKKARIGCTSCHFIYLWRVEAESGKTIVDPCHGFRLNVTFYPPWHSCQICPITSVKHCLFLPLYIRLYVLSNVMIKSY